MKHTSLHPLLSALLTVALVMFLMPTAAHASQININTASASELTQLHGIGQARASAIVEYRDAHGPFRSIEDLQNVPGIGPATMSNIRERITVGDEDANDAAPDESPEEPTDASEDEEVRATPQEQADVDDDVMDLSQPPAPRGQQSPRADEAQERAEAPPSQAASSGRGGININTASASELTQLPMIGAARADAIVADREERGPFRSVDDITRVSGIGDGILRQIRDLVTVGEDQ